MLVVINIIFIGFGVLLLELLFIKIWWLEEDFLRNVSFLIYFICVCIFCNFNVLIFLKDYVYIIKFVMEGDLGYVEVRYQEIYGESYVKIDKML